MDESQGVIAGPVGVKLEPTEYSLGSGARVSQTYAHMMAHLFDPSVGLALTKSLDMKRETWMSTR